GGAQGARHLAAPARVDAALGSGAARGHRRRVRAAARPAARDAPRPDPPADARPSRRAALLRLRAAGAGAARRAARRHRGDRGCVSHVAGGEPADRADAPAGGHLVTAAAIVVAQGLTREFRMTAGPVTAVRQATLTIERGDYIAIGGPSGCGKSTLLHLLGCVDTPTAGTVRFEGRDTAALSDSERGRIRLTRIGFVFQRFFLLPMLTAWENIELPQSEAGVPAAERRERTRALLEYVELSGRADHLPSQLSGGEMQRVAIARALANRPALLLADEPTGELDEETGAQIASLFDRVHGDGTAIVVVTHNPVVAARAGRHLAMKSGRVIAS